MRKVLPLLIFVFSIWVGSLKAQVNFSVPTIETCNATVSVPIIVTGFTNITAFSYSMYWDENILSFNSVGAFNLQHLNNPDFGLTQTGSGFYTLAWVDDDGSGETLADGTTIYTIEFTVLGGMGDFSDIEFSNMPTQIIVGSGFPPASVPVTTTNGLVTVDDTVDPTISCPSNVVINTANPSQVVNGIAPTMFNDNCGVPTITYSSTGATVLSGNNDISGQSFNAMPNSGVTTVTYTATDGKGNTADCSFTVTINQVVADLLVTAVSDTAFCQDSVLAIKIEVDNFASVTALSFSLLWDETKIRFDSVENFNLQHLDNGDFGFGQTSNGVLTFAWIDDDGSGKTVPNGDSIFVVYFTTLVQTTDQSDLTFSNTPTSIVAGQGFPPSSIPIITNNGVGAKVDDPPVFDNCPSNATLVNDAMACGAIHTWPTVTAMDDCDGVIPATQTAGPVSGALFPVGVTTVTYEATDSKNQITTCTFTVTVTDNEAPVPDIAMLPNVTGECSAMAVAPTATDNCAGTVTGTTTDPLTYNTQGTFTIT
ncbi:MAG: HYR domain-containing protein [Saprospiraceae bacterium]